MATPHACAALVDVFPVLLRSKRQFAGTTTTPPLVTLAVLVEHGPLRVSEVAEQLFLDLSTVSRQVAHLRQKGLVASTPDPADGRSQRVAITPDGIEELRTQRRAVVDRLVQRLGGWDDTEIDDLTRLLEKLSRDTAPPAEHRTPRDEDAAHHLDDPSRLTPPRALQRNA